MARPVPPGSGPPLGARGVLNTHFKLRGRVSEADLQVSGYGVTPSAPAPGYSFWTVY
jgi:hypothetical protein